MSDLKNILLNIGAVAGFAGIVALAVLAMLYFSQARDVRRLREWAGREPERAADVELRAQQIASQAIAQVYQAMEAREAEYAARYGTGAAPPHETVVYAPPSELDEAVETTGDVFVAVEPGEGVADGVPQADGEAFVAPGEQQPAGAPSENGHVEPESVEHAGPTETTEGNGEAQPAEAMPGDAPVAPVPLGSEPTGLEPGAPEPPLPDRPQTGDFAGVGAGMGEIRPSRLAPSTPAAARSGGILPPLPPLDTSEFQSVRGPVPAGTGEFAYPPSTETTGAGYYGTIDHPPPPEEPVSRRPFIIAGLLVTIFTGLLIYSLTGGSEEPAQKTAAQKREQRDQRPATSTGKRNPRINRPAVTVTVLNGTQTSGLAKLVGDQLIASGFSETTTGNRNDGVNHVSSVVFYRSGSKLEAEEVAKELDIKSVREIDPDTESVAGSAPVVVVLGADIEK